MRGIEHSLPMQLLRAREAAMVAFRPMLRRHGLTEQQWRGLRVLAEDPALDAGEPARRRLLLAPSLTRILQHLESAGRVRRHRDPCDQRRALFALTATGRRLFNRIAPESEALYARLEAVFGSAALLELTQLLQDFSAAVGDPFATDSSPPTGVSRAQGKIGD